MSNEFYTPQFIMSPRIKIIDFDGVKQGCIVVDLTKEEYVVMEECAYNRWSRTKTGDYGKGHLNKQEGKNDDALTERVGMLGETAFAKIFRKSVDISYKYGGDREDFKIYDTVRVNVKCASRVTDAALLRCRSPHMKVEPLMQDVYVGLYLKYDNRRDKIATVVLVGCVTKKELEEKYEIVSARIWYYPRPHSNYELTFSRIHPIQSLPTMCREVKAAQQLRVE